MRVKAAAFFQIVDLAEQRHRIDHRAVADHASLARMQRARGHQAQDVFLAVDDDRVRRIVAALEADDDIGVAGKQIDNLALALIAPLRADYGYCVHRIPPRARARTQRILIRCASRD